MKQPILEMKNIHKSFSTTVALDGVDLTVYPGEIRGLIGENGSGKSTISSIAAGMQKADQGTMTFLGKPWEPANMVDALNHGFGMIVQEKGTIAGISIAENLFLGDLTKFQSGPFINRKKMAAEARAMLKMVGLSDVDPMLPMESLDLQDRKLVEIAKVVSGKPDIFVVDETTTALSQSGRSRIYELMKAQKNENKSVLFISHDLEELMEMCDTMTVLRDGKMIRNLTKEEFDEDLIKQLMVGRELKGDYYRSDYNGTVSDEVVLSLSGISSAGLRDVSLSLHKGEILGIGGLSSSGMHELGKVAFGALPAACGEVDVRGHKIRDTGDAVRHHIGYLSKDRDLEALNMTASIRDNIAIAALDRIAAPGPFILEKNEQNYVEKERQELSIKCRSIDQQVSELSGGNKQKVVFAKWIGVHSDVLILDCPTRGVDIGVKQAMYQLIYRMKQEGTSFLLISEELTELIGMCDRMLIMKDGALNGEVTRSRELSESDVIGYMI